MQTRCTKTLYYYCDHPKELNLLSKLINLLHLKKLHSTCCLSRHFNWNIIIISSSKSSIFLDAYLLYNIKSSTLFTSVAKDVLNIKN